MIDDAQLKQIMYGNIIEFAFEGLEIYAREQAFLYTMHLKFT